MRPPQGASGHCTSHRCLSTCCNCMMAHELVQVHATRHLCCCTPASKTAANFEHPGTSLCQFGATLAYLRSGPAPKSSASSKM
jgi:hypothetical protein